MEENKNVQVPEEKSPVVRPKAEAVVRNRQAFHWK